MFPFQKMMFNVKLEMLHIAFKYTGLQECKNNIPCKDRKKKDTETKADISEMRWNGVCV